MFRRAATSTGILPITGGPATRRPTATEHRVCAYASTNQYHIPDYYIGGVPFGGLSFVALNGDPDLATAISNGDVDPASFNQLLPTDPNTARMIAAEHRSSPACSMADLVSILAGASPAGHPASRPRLLTRMEIVKQRTTKKDGELLRYERQQHYLLYFCRPIPPRTL